MIDLFLEGLNFHEDDGNSAKMRISLLNEVESIIWSLMASGGRSEARLWLCNTIAGMISITPRHQRDIFMSLLRSKPLKQGLVSQLLRMMFEKRPHRAGAVLARRCYILEKFFEGNPRRISEWFSSFATIGGSDHAKGAKALSQFAFVNRDICWEELEWKGKHGQSPAVVATKPHYFLDLDVQQTVDNFLHNVPEFWSSSEFADSVKDGEILFIDANFFLDYFVELMFKEDSIDVWEVVDEYLMKESFSFLCQHLLITLEEADLYNFLEMLVKFINPKIEPKELGNSSYLFEVILSKCSDRGSTDQILILNAVINQGRQLLRLLRDEEAHTEKARLKDIVVQICAIPRNTNSLSPILEACCKRKTIESIKLLGLQSWVLHYRMSEECCTAESWESLFIDNGISFKKSTDYTLLDSDLFTEKSGLVLDHAASIKGKHGKRGKSRKKRRRDYDNEYINDNELLHFETEDDKHGLQLNAGSWLLSTDGYTVSWNAVDLAEHLSKHCMSSWMKWVFSQWSEA